MKKLILTLLTVIMSVGMANAIIDKYSINREDLPTQAQEMLEKHFPKAKVSMIKVDRHLLKKTDYDVKLVNGTKIEFNNSGKWTSVDCGKRQVPDDLVPKSIRNYVSKNLDAVKIVSILKRKVGGYDIGLATGKIYRFNALYQFKGEITPSELQEDIEALHSEED